jgi:hypothetical protein
MPSPYALAGATLVANGFSAIPCAPGTKVPGKLTAGEWRFHFDWTRF